MKTICYFGVCFYYRTLFVFDRLVVNITYLPVCLFVCLSESEMSYNRHVEVREVWVYARTR